MNNFQPYEYPLAYISYLALYMIQQPKLNRQQSGPSLRGTIRSPVPERQSQKIPFSVKSCFLRRSSEEGENAERFNVGTIIRSTLGSLCKLCETRYNSQEMVQVSQQCNHTFCEKCMKEYIAYKIAVTEELRCPQEQCAFNFNTNQPFFDSLPIETKKRYQKYLIWKQTIDNPNLKLCPTEDCNGYLNDFNKCPKCNISFCSQCMLREHKGPCDINFQKQFSDWKRCPQCRVFIERNEGCNHMSCRCGHQFCYICLSNWDPQHYQCGQMGQDIRIFIQQNRYIQNFRQLSRCRQITLAIAMIIILPILLVLAISVCLICCSIGAGIAAVISPFYFLGLLCTESRQCELKFFLFVILVATCPIVMAVTAVIAFFAILVEFIANGWRFLRTYITCICFLFDPTEVQQQENLSEMVEQINIDEQFQ